MTPETFLERAGYPDLGWDHDAPPYVAPVYDPPSAEIMDAVAQITGYSVAQLVGERRDGPVVTARWAAILLCRERLACSLPFLGRIFRRDHTTILHALRRGREHLADGTERGRRMAAIMAQARAGG